MSWSFGSVRTCVHAYVCVCVYVCEGGLRFQVELEVSLGTLRLHDLWVWLVVSEEQLSKYLVKQDRAILNWLCVYKCAVGTGAVKMGESREGNKGTLR